MTLFYPNHKEEFIKSLPHVGALLALDVGRKRIGVAVSDITRLVATPLHTIHRKKFSDVMATFVKLIQKYEAVGIVVGYPYEMSGNEGVACQSVRHFSHNALTALQEYSMYLPLLLWDERSSSQGAEKAMLEADMSRKKRADRIDNVAAGLILQSFLEFSLFIN